MESHQAFLKVRIETWVRFNLGSWLVSWLRSWRRWRFTHYVIFQTGDTTIVVVSCWKLVYELLLDRWACLFKASFYEGNPLRSSLLLSSMCYESSWRRSCCKSNALGGGILPCVSWWFYAIITDHMKIIKTHWLVKLGWFVSTLPICLKLRAFLSEYRPSRLINLASNLDYRLYRCDSSNL